MFNIDLYRENVKKSSCLKPQGLEPCYLVCSITKWTSTKIVQIIALGPKMVPLRGGGGGGDFLHVTCFT